MLSIVTVLFHLLSLYKRKLSTSKESIKLIEKVQDMITVAKGQISEVLTEDVLPCLSKEVFVGTVLYDIISYGLKLIKFFTRIKSLDHNSTQN